MHRLFVVGRSGVTLADNTQASHCSDFSCFGTWALGAQGSIIVVHGLSCSEACGIFMDQGSNPCALHWQVDS